MGLLDQVIGQVLGQMGGPSTQQQSSSAGPLGGLGGLLGGNAGKYAPIVMALLSLLASRNQMQSSAGSGGVLGDILGQLTGGQRSAPGGSLGQGTNPGSGFDPFGRGQQAQPYDDEAPQPGAGRSASPGGFLNEIGSMMGGPSGQPASSPPDGSGVIGSGLGGLFEQFRRNGHGDTIESWIGGGPNQQVSPSQLEEALSPGTVEALARQTGLEKGDLLSQLSHALPQVVDKLTPHNRLPTQEEHQSWL